MYAGDFERDPARFIIDEDFDNDILRGVLRRLPELPIVRAQDVGHSGAKDPVVLERAAQEGRVLITHDVSTTTARGAARARAGFPMPGVFTISQSCPIGKPIEETLSLGDGKTGLPAFPPDRTFGSRFHKSPSLQGEL